MTGSRIVAVTGATGFVGQHLVARLLAAGETVRVLVRDREKLLIKHPGLEIVEGDLSNSATLDMLVGGVACIYHCAGAIAGLDRKSFFCTNQAGALNVARAARGAKVPRFVHVSSLAAREPQLSYYSASKAAGEQIVRELIAPENLVIVRPPAVYGPGDKATLPLIKMLAGGVVVVPGLSNQRISWIFVGDLVAALIHLGKAKKVPNEIIELDDGHGQGERQGYSWRELVDCVAEVRSKPIRLVLLPRWLVSVAGWLALAKARLTGHPDVFSPQKVHELYHANWAARREEIKGWEPKTGFASGFVQTLDWYRQNHWLPGQAVAGKKQQDQSS